MRIIFTIAAMLSLLATSCTIDITSSKESGYYACENDLDCLSGYQCRIPANSQTAVCMLTEEITDQDKIPDDGDSNTEFTGDDDTPDGDNDTSDGDDDIISGDSDTDLLGDDDLPGGDSLNGDDDLPGGDSLAGDYDPDCNNCDSCTCCAACDLQCLQNQGTFISCLTPCTNDNVCQANERCAYHPAFEPLTAEDGVCQPKCDFETDCVHPQKCLMLAAPNAISLQDPGPGASVCTVPAGDVCTYKWAPPYVTKFDTIEEEWTLDMSTDIATVMSTNHNINLHGIHTIQLDRDFLSWIHVNSSEIEWSYGYMWINHPSHCSQTGLDAVDQNETHIALQTKALSPNEQAVVFDWGLSGGHAMIQRTHTKDSSSCNQTSHSLNNFSHEGVTLGRSRSGEIYAVAIEDNIPEKILGYMPFSNFDTSFSNVYPYNPTIEQMRSVAFSNGRLFMAAVRDSASTFNIFHAGLPGSNEAKTDLFLTNRASTGPDVMISDNDYLVYAIPVGSPISNWSLEAVHIDPDSNMLSTPVLLSNNVFLPPMVMGTGVLNNDSLTFDIAGSFVVWVEEVAANNHYQLKAKDLYACDNKNINITPEIKDFCSTTNPAAYISHVRASMFYENGQNHLIITWVEHCTDGMMATFSWDRIRLFHKTF